MTKNEAAELFITEYYGSKYNLRKAIDDDKVEVRCSWVDFTDWLCRDGYITQKQYDTWTCPWRSVYK